MPEKGEESSDKLASQAPSREKQMLGLVEDLLQGKHRILIDGKALPVSETAYRLAHLQYFNEFVGVVRDAVRESKYRRATWENPETGPGTWLFPSDYWIHFELDVNTSLLHVGYPKAIRCEDKSCPENR
jgi:hypothetical protein